MPSRLRLLLPVLAAVAVTLGNPARSHALAAVTPSSTALAAAASRDTVTLHVEGMTCGGCTLATRKVLKRLDGVSKVDVSYEEKRATVIFDATKVTVQRMIAAVATLTYTATVMKRPGA